MKITQKLVDNVVRELVGEDALPAVAYLFDKQNVSEFIIAEDLDIEIHQMRNILYRCYEHNILTFNRKKDKKKGWYICYWNFNKDQISHLVGKIHTAKLAKMQERLKKEQGSQFFMCEAACTRMDFERAVEYEFRCPECSEIMNQQDNARTIEFLTQRVDELKKAEVPF